MESKENIILEFNQFTATYTQDMERWVPHYRKMVSSVIDYLPSGSAHKF